LFAKFGDFLLKAALHFFCAFYHFINGLDNLIDLSSGRVYQLTVENEDVHQGDDNFDNHQPLALQELPKQGDQSPLGDNLEQPESYPLGWVVVAEDGAHEGDQPASQKHEGR
jgi:hypothetical protein